MQPSGTSPATSNHANVSLRPVVLVAAIALAVRIIYLVWICRYELVEDEAHYWLWSRWLEWSYYSKGPGVAWAIRASTMIFGDAEWAVRLPTAIASAIGTLAIGVLARDVVRDGPGGGATPRRVGLLAALAYTLAPALQATAIVMTIDGPYVACWSVACWACWRATRPGGNAAFWPLVGAAIGLGFLFKYTILLLIPGLLAFALIAARRSGRAAPPRISQSKRGVFIASAALLVLAGIAPVVYWNAHHHWPTLKHLLGHLGIAGGDMPVAKPGSGSVGSKWSVWWLPELIGQQIAIIGPWLFLAFLPWVPRFSEPGERVVRLSEPRGGLNTNQSTGNGRLFLLCCAAPILIFYAIVSLITEPEGNWPMAAYATLLPLAAWIGADALAQRAALRARGERVPGPIKLRARLWRIGLTYAIIAAVLVHMLDRVGDVALALDKRHWFHDRYHTLLGRDPSKPESAIRDPAGRLRGAKEMAAHVSELLTGLRDGTQQEPFVIAQHYGRASQLAYYLRLSDRPWTQVLCAMAHTGGRESQFDYWAQTDLRRADLRANLFGRPAIIITSTQPYIADQWRTMFSEVRPIPEQRLRGESKTDRSAMLGFGWKGVPGMVPLGAPPAPVPIAPNDPPRTP